MWMWIANKFKKFHAKRLAKIKMLLNVLGGYFFFKHTVVLVLTHWYLSSADTNSNQKQENSLSKSVGEFHCFSALYTVSLWSTYFALRTVLVQQDKINIGMVSADLTTLTLVHQTSA